ncbi:MAG: hypothetical protein ACKV2T_08660 [Kofleriaceae bacterium]
MSRSRQVVASDALVAVRAGATVAGGVVMANRHELHAFNYVNRPYADVRREMLAGPLELFRDATANAGDTDGKAELHVKAAGLDVSAEIDIELLSVHEELDVPRPTTKLEIAWRATRRPGLFPKLRATLSMYPLSPTETQLELSGVYEPPMGAFGDAIDVIAMRDRARESVQRFVDDTAAWLRR